MAQRELKIVERGACKEIADKFGCTTATVTNALKARAYSMLTLKIRRYAMQNYTCVYFTGQGTAKRRYEVVRICQACRHHIETREPRHNLQEAGAVRNSRGIQRLRPQGLAVRTDLPVLRASAR